MPNISIREANADDSELILKFIIELAIYQEAKDCVKSSAEEIRSTLFSKTSTTKALICSVDDEPVGFAVYYNNYSTWLGKHGIYLEDIYINNKYRGIGAGKHLLKHVAKIAHENGAHRLEWSVMHTNHAAIKFYDSIGAKAKDEWLGYQLAGIALVNFVEE